MVLTILNQQRPSKKYVKLLDNFLLNLKRNISSKSVTHPFARFESLALFSG